MEQLDEEDFLDDSFGAKLSGKSGIVNFIQYLILYCNIIIYIKTNKIGLMK